MMHYYKLINYYMYVIMYKYIIILFIIHFTGSKILNIRKYLYFMNLLAIYAMTTVGLETHVPFDIILTYAESNLLQYNTCQW